MEEMGVPLEKLVTYRWAAPISDPDGIQGWVVHIDRFGNLVTNISEEIITETARDQAIRIYVGNTILDEIDETFASVTEEIGRASCRERVEVGGVSVSV